MSVENDHLVCFGCKTIIKGNRQDSRRCRNQECTEEKDMMYLNFPFDRHPQDEDEWKMLARCFWGMPEMFLGSAENRVECPWLEVRV